MKVFQPLLLFYVCVIDHIITTTRAFVQTTRKPFQALKRTTTTTTTTTKLLLSSSASASAASPIEDVNLVGTPTELPDSLEDAAELAAKACTSFFNSDPAVPRCRVDFDTSAGDETYTQLKASTEFMQAYTSALCNGMIPNLLQQRQEEMMRVIQAQTAYQELDNDDDDNNDKRRELMDIIVNKGKNASATWEGPLCRIYFPDEGSAALARRDWADIMPPCVAYSACGGVKASGDDTTSRDSLVLFFCPRASEVEFIEETLATMPLNMSCVFVNPLLVDMGVTGFGMRGRLLRERLIDQLEYIYYLRTLTWGALTRLWPQDYTVWQEDETAMGGYRCISQLNRLPSNPEVETIYELENSEGEGSSDGDFLGSIGSFVEGMMKL